MRIFVLLAVVACGGKPAVNPTTSSTQPAELPAGAQECTASVESAKAGHHDRYAFQGADELYGYKDSKGHVVIAPRLKYAYEFKEGGIAAAVDGDASFVFIDTSGKVIAHAFAYDNGPDYFQEGVARIVDDKGKVGFIDDKGTIAIAPRFDEADSFCHGKAAVREGGKQLWIDKHGEPTAAPPPAPAAPDDPN